MAVYTSGYQGKSIDRFFNDLLEMGVRAIADIRANPVSRKYGFARSALSRSARTLNIQYEHLPRLGIPRDMRANLDGRASYQRLLKHYERSVLPKREADVAELARLAELVPTTLLCQERDVAYCHRSRLAEAVARVSGLPVHHLP